MDFTNYTDNELKFFIEIIDSVLNDYLNKINSLGDLKDEFVTELDTRSVKNG